MQEELSLWLWLCVALQNLESTCGPIMTKPKPKVEPPKEKKEGEKEKAGGDSSKKSAAQDGPQENSAESTKPDMDVD